MLNNANSPRQRLTRRRRSSSATIHGHCHSLNGSPNSSTTTIAHERHRSISPAAPPVVRRQRLDLDWRRSKRSASELAGLRFLVLSHIDELEKRLGTLESASATPCRDQSEEPSSAQAQPVKSDGSRSVRSPSPTSTVISSRSTSVAPSSHSNARSPTRSRSSSVSSWTNDLNLPTWDSEFDFSAVDDLRTWVRESLDQLAHLRDEVSARLPDLEEIKGHLPEFEWDFDAMGLQADELLHEFRAKLSKVEVPNMAEMKTKIGDWGYEYLPTLSDHLSNLHARLTERAKEVEFHSKTFDRGNAILRDFIDALMYNDEDSPTERKRVVDEVERTVLEVHHALEISEGGHKLILYHQLPAKWRNNEHVVSGYRFIPIQNWPTLLLSTFHLHNETANIHTHLLPLVSLVYLFGSEAYSSYLTSTSLYALPTTLFSLFSLLCLVTSVGWHIFAGCSSPKIMETAARVDYLGIGWLISASIATLVYYAFSCRTLPFTIYISMTIVAGLAGSVLPFMEWFNERKHKKWRVVFFLSLALTGFIPVLHLSILHGFQEALRYVAPISPSLASYVFGLCFYACHFPECLWTPEEANQGVYEHIHEGEKKIDNLHQHSRKRWTDHFGGGSHAIWHISIVVAIWLHRSAIPTLAEGLGGEQCDVWNRG